MRFVVMALVGAAVFLAVGYSLGQFFVSPELILSVIRK